MSLFTGIDDVARAPWSGPPQTYRILKFVMGSFELASAFPTEGSVLDPCYEMLEEFTE
jgi:hypothetical protein